MTAGGEFRLFLPTLPLRGLRIFNNLDIIYVANNRVRGTYT